MRLAQRHRIRQQRLRQAVAVLSHTEGQWRRFTTEHRRKVIATFKKRNRTTARVRASEIEHLFNLPMPLVAEICATVHADAGTEQGDYERAWKVTYDLIHGLDALTYELLLEALHAMQDHSVAAAPQAHIALQ